MTKEEQFVNELIGYIFAYPDDDYMTMECLCRKLHKYGLVDKKDGFYLAADDTLRKTENSSEIPNNCERDCFLCKWLGDVDVCGRCRNRNLFAEAEPQPRCPKCGKRGYIRSLESMGVKLKVFDEYKWKCTNCNKYFKEEPKDEPTISKMEQVDKDINVRSKEPQTDPCDGCACDDGKHLMYCMNCKGIVWKTEPPKVEDVPKAGMSDMSEIDKMIKMVDGILGDDDLCEGCEYVIEGLSCDECRRKYADKIIKILRSVRKAIKDEPQKESK